MTENRVTLLSSRKPTENLLERARAGRRTALVDRTVTIVETSTDGQTVTEHRFSGMPRMADVIARLGGDVHILSLRTERLDGRGSSTPVIAAE